MTKILKVEERYKFPRGEKIAEIREITYSTKFYNGTVLNRCVYPQVCIDGWYVVDAVKVDPNQIVVTFGRVNWE